MYLWPRDPEIDFDYDKNQLQVLKKELSYLRTYFDKFDDLSVEDKKELINHLLKYDYDTKDICLITNSITKADHSKIVELPTKMETSYVHQEGRGRDFSYWTTFHEINYLATANEDFEVKNDRYSFSDMMSMYYSRIICPIHQFTKELYYYSDDREPVKKINTLEDIGIKVDPYPEFEQFNLEFDNSAKDYQNLIFEHANLNRAFLDKKVLKYFDKLIDYSKGRALHEDEKKYVRRMKNYYDTKK